jgi:ABC-type transporter MlaC component
VTIEGISYLQSFREDFGEEIEQKGLDELIGVASVLRTDFLFG